MNLFIWREDLDSAIVADFEKQFDCSVRIDHYDSIEALIAKLAHGGDSAYDVVAPGSGVLPVLVKRSLLAPLRQERIPNFKHIDPDGVRFQPFSGFSVPVGEGEDPAVLMVGGREINPGPDVGTGKEEPDGLVARPAPPARNGDAPHKINRFPD